MILFYLAVGAWLGGKLADRFPHRRGLETIITLGALGVALVPTFSPFVLHWAATGLDSFDVSLLISALIAVLLLFSLPVILLGTVSPWAVRLAVKDVAQSGRTSGQLYAIATAGSLVGTFLPVLWLIPTYGTRWTFYLLSLTLLVIVSVGAIRHAHRWLPLLALMGVLLLAFFLHPGSSIRSGWDDGKNGKIIYEDESVYNYIAVRQWGPERHLKLNDGIGIHSVYHPQMVLSDGIWDYFLLAPLFKPPSRPLVAPKNLLLIGLAAGTISELFTNIYGPLPITGVELDPQIIDVGRRYFNMNQPNLTAIAADGRRWLSQQPATAQWDLIAVDAYRPPYIPFHLTALEFFQLVRSHLSDQGVLAINVGRTASDFALVDALSKTVGQVFPAVYLIDQPGPADNLSNSLLVATMQPTHLENFAANVAALPTTRPAEFRKFAHDALAQARVATPPVTAPIFTDDRAPVEQVVHQIIWSFLAGK
jgi:spermidine synthase